MFIELAKHLKREGAIRVVIVVDYAGSLRLFFLQVFLPPMLLIEFVDCCAEVDSVQSAIEVDEVALCPTGMTEPEARREVHGTTRFVILMRRAVDLGFSRSIADIKVRILKAKE